MAEVKDNLREFAKKAGQYFLDFLETDFKRQQPPRRRVQLKNDANQTTGIALHKYQSLYTAVINLLNENDHGSQTLVIPRGKYTAKVSPQLKDLACKYIDEYDAQKFSNIISKTLETAKIELPSAALNPEAYTSLVCAVLEEATAFEVVRPLLTLLESTIIGNSYSAVESIFEIETELVAILTQDVERQLPEILNSYIVSGNETIIRDLLIEFLDEQQCRQKLKDFLETFAVSDVWQEIRDLRSLTRMGDNLQLYLYVCDIRFGANIFPIFYIPLSIFQEESSDKFHIQFDSNLCINKRAVDYVTQELAIPESVRLNHQIQERIIHLETDVMVISMLINIISRLLNLFNLDSDFVLDNVTVQTAKSSRVALSTSCYMAVFDRSDEALLNDYEALLTALRSGDAALGGLFEKVLKGFLQDDPVNAFAGVEQNWESLSVPGRLVTESPIPLNEEQRKILIALNQPHVRNLIVHGPPGTGKSHTITAIAFEYILQGKTVLVLSDKMEALDVVEDKLTKAMNQARPSESFQNPILRLGKIGGTYAKLLKQDSIETIQRQYRAASSHRYEIEEGIAKSKNQLSENIANLINWISGISIEDIQQMHMLESALVKRIPELEALTKQEQWPALEVELEQAKFWQTSIEYNESVQYMIANAPTTIADLLMSMRKSTVATKLDMLTTHKQAFSAFRKLCPNDSRRLQSFIARYQTLQVPLLGHFGTELFHNKKLRQLNSEMAENFVADYSLNFHKRINDLESVCMLLPKAGDIQRAWAISDSDFENIYEEIVHRQTKFFDFSAFLSLAQAMNVVIQQSSQLDITNYEIGNGRLFNNVAEVIQFYFDVAELLRLLISITNQEKNVPRFDFVGNRGQLEQLCTTKMTLEMDSRFVQFVEQASATARTLAAVIRAKQKFPQDAFERLRDAFPCIIASIREFAEYIPLYTEMFDLVVIDEASQVSVAQAFPALMRAKKVLVLGDRKQFSNVKAAFASGERNAAYVNDLKDYYRRNISSSADKMARATLFDVKRSILEFCELLGNYSIMLRKHFRGYQELISFSSRYFYGGGLQAVKFRGKPIEEVIKFTVLAHDRRAEKYRNTNSQEAEYIRDLLNSYLQMDSPPTVGIITPFREQVILITQLLLAESNTSAYDERLKLKIMTFDTCQGEEREIIIYSMVATLDHDALKYIFPIQLSETDERVDEQLKMQRLNVGFSRAQECVHFILSKPIEQYSGSIRTALQHYDNQLKEKSGIELDDTDKSSPMEQRLMQWLYASDFFRNNSDRIELRPQFPIGDYLKQLDPLYRHPPFRADLLLMFREPDKTINIVVEYDGFREHFIEHGKIYDPNFAYYYKPGDIEKQMVLESYGYKFLRINRFNLGADPVFTLSQRLYSLVDTVRVENTAHEITAKVQNDVKSLQNGDMKYCQKCKQSKSIITFYNPSLTTGYGRYCRDCQKTGKRKSKTIDMAPLETEKEAESVFVPPPGMLDITDLSGTP